MKPRKSDDDGVSMGELNKKKSPSIPVSLGKPSLRRRLEAYYSLVAPEVIANEGEWLGRYDQIYDKYGGSHERERKLATKLTKKYGNTVRLLLAESASPQKRTWTTGRDGTIQQQQKRDEEWYTLEQQQRNSGIVSFVSESFDPMAALTLPEANVLQHNPFVAACPRLDRLDQCRSHLPPCDPLYRLPALRSSSLSSLTHPVPKKQPSVFVQLAEPLAKGPYVVLYNAFVHRRRVRVLVRYVRAIRGTLTGYLVAFDKHMNMILRDVDEVFSRPLPSATTADLSNTEREIQRRQQQLQHTQTNRVSQRHMKQMLVRGDNVVLVYMAEDERSAALSMTIKTSVQSVYRKKDSQGMETGFVGTPGALLHIHQRNERRRQQHQR